MQFVFALPWDCDLLNEAHYGEAVKSLIARLASLKIEPRSPQIIS